MIYHYLFVLLIIMGLTTSCSGSPKLPEIIDLEDVDVKSLCLDVTFPRNTHNYGNDYGAVNVLADVLEAMGFQIEEDESSCDAKMIINLEGDASVYPYELYIPPDSEASQYVRAVYELSNDFRAQPGTHNLRCYSGAEVAGAWTVITSNNDQRVFPIRATIEPPFRIYIDDCDGSEGSPDSILREASTKAMFIGIAEVWGDSTLMLALRNPNKATFFDYGVYHLAQYGLEQGAPDNIPILIQGLNHESDTVRRGVAEVLLRIGPDAKNAIPALTEICEHDNVGAVRTAACLALDEIK